MLPPPAQGRTTVGITAGVVSRRSALALAALVALLLVGCGGGGGGGVPKRPVPKSAPGEFGGNVVRITGRSPADVAAAAVLAAYPPNRNQQPNGWVLLHRDRWQDALLAAQFAARPVAGALVPIAAQFIPSASQDVLARLHPSSFPLSHGIQAMLLGEAGQDVLVALHDLKLNLAQLKAPDAAKLSLRLAPYRGGFAHAYSSQMLVVSDEDRDYGLPAGAWSAYSGDTIAFVHRNGIPAATAALLVQRNKLRAEKPTIYLVGPETVISRKVAGELGAYGTVKRVAGPNPVDNAIAFARYRDAKTGFGWGLTRGPASISLLNPHDWGNTVGAFNFAATGPQAPLLLTTMSGGLSPTLRRYLTQLRAVQANQGFVFGDAGSVPSATLREFDQALAGKP
jgi:hypothetical protein